MDKYDIILKHEKKQSAIVKILTLMFYLLLISIFANMTYNKSVENLCNIQKVKSYYKICKN